MRQLWLPLLPQNEIPDDHTYVSELEHWVLREYVSKYIVNGVRAYEWFGYDWYLPLWDNAFIEFWQSVPNAFRQNMALYRQVLSDDWFQPLGLTFPEDNQVSGSNPLSPTTWLPPQWKKSLKQYLPTTATQNINGLQKLIPIIQEQLNWPEQNLNKSVNEMIGQWYHDFLNKPNL
jgi:hypothetical protein